MGVAVLFLLFAVVVVISAGPSTHALATGPSVPTSSRTLVERFIDRSRRYRRGGAWVGILLTGLLALVSEVEGQPLVGADGVDLGVLFAVGLGGSIAGAVAAEAFRLRRPRGVRTASLEPRDLSRYDDPVTHRREVAIAAVAVVAAAAGVAAGTFGPALWLVPIALLAGVRRWATRRIAVRPRPALPAELVEADDLVRELAASAGLGRPLATLALLVLSFQLGDLADAAVRWGEEGAGWIADVVVTASALGALAALILAVVWWARNRSFGLVPARASGVSFAAVGRAALIAVLVLAPFALVVAGRG